MNTAKIASIAAAGAIVGATCAFGGTLTWVGGVAKTGGGDLAANMLNGDVSVSGGRLLTGGFHSDRATVTENGTVIIMR